MSDLPIGWTYSELGDVVDILDSRRIPVNAAERSKRVGLIPYYGATGQVGWIDDHIFDEELVLLGEDGAPFLDPTRPKAYLISGRSWVNNHAHVLRGSAGIGNRFLLYQLHQVDYHQFVSGTTRLKLPQSQLKAIPLVVPPLAEQQRIVAEIETQLTRLDAAMAALKRSQANLKRYRASVLKAAVEGRLVEPKCQMNGNERGEIPSEWQWRTLSEVATIKGGITKGQKRRPGDILRWVPYLRVANVQRGRLDLSDVKEIEAAEAVVNELRLQRGDILFNEGGDRDKLGRGWIWEEQLPECIHQNHVFRARLLSADMQPKFVSWYGNTEGQKYFYDEGKQTTNLASINMTKLGKLPIPIPPPEEQRRIVEEVERRFSVVDAIEKTVVNGLARGERLRQAILRKAFAGELVPQDPNDEPASILLERIRAERAAATSSKRAKRA